MNYRTLRVDELERLAYVGDDKAKFALADSQEVVPLSQAEEQAAEAAEDAEATGYKAACKDIFSRYAEAILSASNGNRDDDVCEMLKALMEFLEENS